MLVVLVFVVSLGNSSFFILILENITNTPFINTFKSRLDKFIENEDISCSVFRAELSFKFGSGRNGNNERCMERVWCRGPL
jgi:hypothetical protein